MKTSKLLSIFSLACLCSTAFADSNQGSGNSIFAPNNNQNVVAVPVATPVAVAPVGVGELDTHMNTMNAKIDAMMRDPAVMNNPAMKAHMNELQGHMRNMRDAYGRMGTQAHQGAQARPGVQQHRGGLGRR